MWFLMKQTLPSSIVSSSNHKTKMFENVLRVVWLIWTLEASAWYDKMLVINIKYEHEIERILRNTIVHWYTRQDIFEGKVWRIYPEHTFFLMNLQFETWELFIHLEALILQNLVFKPICSEHIIATHNENCICRIVGLVTFMHSRVFSYCSCSQLYPLISAL